MGVNTYDESLSLTPEQREDFKLPYIMKTTLKTGKNEYHDISWTIDKRGVEYYILADGFAPSDKITLIINDQPAYTIPFDWSGRIELPIMLIIAEDTKTCIDIHESKEKLSFCHMTTGKKEI